MKLKLSIATALLTTGILGCGVFLVGAGQQPTVAPPGTSPQPVLPLPGRSTVSEVNTLYMPPGKYTAIVIATTAKNRRWIVSLKSTRGSFPITVGDETTIVIPFDDGWQVKADDQARLESKFVPWEDIGERNLLDGNEYVSLAAWGITDQGPVSFSPPVKRK
jgi:hypothetical protein